MPGADAAYCERVVREHARTFTLASYFLPPAKRRAAFALYAFCREADDMVDAALERHDPLVARRLADFGRRLDEALSGRPSGALFRELAWAVGEYGVPDEVLHELLDGVARDLRPTRYETWAELARYCEGVASSVGEMCTHVFGVPGDEGARRAALGYARALGVAMQLTNILRDVGEDARGGRCYLPREDLARFGLDAGRILAAADSTRGSHADAAALVADERWRAFMQFEIARARAIYATATPGIALLSPDTRRCAAACARGYAGILGAIEQNAYDSISRRCRVSQWSRVSVLFGAWRDGSSALPGQALPTPPAALDWDTTPGTASHSDMVKWA
ncbi:MAG TPA: phytoene/squalene synthase family protein [Gemmatimonadaceae bacterium]|nr:phytoene/squalene synthase family protein [Gemmatimonadaceae bacterium]